MNRGLAAKDRRSQRRRPKAAIAVKDARVRVGAEGIKFEHDNLNFCDVRYGFQLGGFRSMARAPAEIVQILGQEGMTYSSLRSRSSKRGRIIREVSWWRDPWLLGPAGKWKLFVTRPAEEELCGIGP